MYEARQNKEKVSRRIDGGGMERQRIKIINQRRNIVIQREPFEKLSDFDWCRVSKAIDAAKQICNFWLQNPDQFNTVAADAFNRRDVSQRTYIPQLEKILNVLNKLSYSNFLKDTSDEDYYAMVLPTDLNHTIKLGAAFWNAPDEGKDSKAGTLIHEITHFLDVIGTDDHGYGDDANVQSNYGLSSTLGGNNADTWEHFIEF